MILSANRILFSESEVFNTIKQKGRTLDLTFTMPKNHIKPETFTHELQMIQSVNLPLKNNILGALKEGKIILGRSETNVGSSLLFTFGMDSSKDNIAKVFVNMSKFTKVSMDRVNVKTGDLEKQTVMIGGWETLWELLYAAYIGLNAKRLYRNSTLVKYMKTFYTDIMAQITSYAFGNPADGVKFRYLTDILFFNGNINPRDLAEDVKFNLATVNILTEAYPKYFTAPNGLKITDWIKVVNSEFKVFKKPVNLDDLVGTAITGLGDTGVYLLDNGVYLLCVMAAKAMSKKYTSLLKSQSKIIQGGYMLRQVETAASAINSEIFNILM